MSLFEKLGVDFAEMKVLFAEDNEFALNLGRTALEELGFRTVICVRDGAEAFDTLSLFPDFDLIVSDWNMPNINGLDFFKAARDRWPNIPFVMVTTNDKMEQVHEANAASVDAYVLKPYTLNALRAKIIQAIRKQLAIDTSPKADREPALVKALGNVSAVTLHAADVPEPAARPEVERLQEAVERALFSPETRELSRPALETAVQGIREETPVSNPHRDSICSIVDHLDGFMANVGVPTPTQLEVIKLHIEAIRVLTAEPDKVAPAAGGRLIEGLRMASAKTGA